MVARSRNIFLYCLNKKKSTSVNETHFIQIEFRRLKRNVLRSSSNVPHNSALFQLNLNYYEYFHPVSNKTLHGKLSNEIRTDTGGDTDGEIRSKLAFLCLYKRA